MEYLIGAGVLIVCIAWVWVGYRVSRRPDVPRIDVMPTVCLLLEAADYFDAECDEEGDSLRKRMRKEIQRLESYGRGEE